jgi:hypothetical protein
MSTKSTIGESVISHPLAARANALLIRAFSRLARSTSATKRAIGLRATEDKVATITSARSCAGNIVIIIRIFVVVRIIIVKVVVHVVQ